MAFSLIDLWLVERLRQQGYLPNGSAIAEIGAQQIDDSVLDNRGDLIKLGKAFGIDRPCPALSAPRPKDAPHRLVGLPASRETWDWLGFSYVAIDIDETPGSIALDLNYDDVPEDLKGRHQLVTNFGTTEHVANQLNAFKIIHDLTARGGVMVHNLPCHQPDHGLVNYTCKFFWMLARSNDYREIYMSPMDENTSGIVVALQRQHALDFVAPIDVESGAQTSNEALRRRYWTVFDKKTLDTIAYAAQADFGKTRRPFHALRHTLASRMPWLIPLKRKLAALVCGQ